MSKVPGDRHLGIEKRTRDQIYGSGGEATRILV